MNRNNDCRCIYLLRILTKLGKRISISSFAESNVIWWIGPSLLILKYWWNELDQCALNMTLSHYTFNTWLLVWLPPLNVSRRNEIDVCLPARIHVRSKEANISKILPFIFKYKTIHCYSYRIYNDTVCDGIWTRYCTDLATNLTFSLGHLLLLQRQISDFSSSTIMSLDI